VSGVKKASSRVGWYAVTPEQELAGVEPMAGATLNPVAEGYVLTADGNIVHSRVNITYHVQYPVVYVFNFVNASNAIEAALDNALLYAASRFTVDKIVTSDIIGFREAVRQRANEIVDQQNLGIVIEQCSVNSVPPRQLKQAFENVLKAEVTRGKVLNEALSYRNQKLSKARADAESIKNTAESERIRYVSSVSSSARQFEDLLPKYQANPELFRQQRLAQTLSRVLTNLDNKILVPEGAGQTRLLLNQAPPKPAEEQKQ
jgi:modulator of FtsH protease HflK